MIPLFKPFMHQPAVNEAVCKVLSYREDGSLYCGEGPLVKEFERQFAALLGADPATVVAVNSCSSALALALQLCGVEHPGYWAEGDPFRWEVISTPMTCTATNEAIVNAGGRIVWADIDPHTGIIDPADVARKITPHTKAIMAVNWSGARPESTRLWEAAGHIPIIVDAAHGPFGQLYGTYTAFSFGPIKHLSAGDGGALVLPHSQAARARKLRWHGLSRDSSADFRCEQDIIEPGGKLHMNDINAAIGLANLPHAEWVVARHRLNAEYYHRALAGLPGVRLAPFDPGSSYWLLGLLLEDRDGFQEYMKAHGVAVSRAHRRNDVHPAYTFPNGPLPGVDFFDAHQTNVPCGWWINEQDRAHIAGLIHQWAYSARRAA